MKKLFELYYGMVSLFDEAKALNADRFFSDRGLFVNPEYKELGVELEFLKARLVSL